MNPIFLILYAVIVTLVLTLAFPRLRTTNPQLARILLVAGVAGLLVLVLVMIF